MSQPALSGFDWNELEPETKVHVQAATERLHQLERRTGEAIIEIGRTLIDVKSRIGHGNFGAWLEAEFGWSTSAATKFMQAAEVFGVKSVNFTNIAPSALYALASGTIPEPIRDEFIARAEAGERVTHKDVKQRLAVVDLDSGEIDPEPVASEPFDGPLFPIPPQRQTHSSTSLVNDSARVFSEGLIEAVAPSRILGALADTKFKVRASLVALGAFPGDVIVQYGDSREAREHLAAIIEEAGKLQSKAQALHTRLSSGERIRAVK